ncbi:hypothetical protein [Prochlorococcus marinus]|nr:hypothetical protein [Prochlorococcus marinus]
MSKRRYQAVVDQGFLLRLNTPAFFDVCCHWCFTSPDLPEDVVVADLESL